MNRTILIAAIAVLFTAGVSRAQVVVYDTVTPDPVAGYGEPNDNAPIFGDALNLDQGGQLQQLGFDIFNTDEGAGVINTGTVQINLYDNTVPYTSGSLAGTHPLIGTVTVNIDFSQFGGLPAGFYTQVFTDDLTSLNINLPQNIFITQQFTLADGDSTSNGAILSSQDSAVGSSPETVYLNSSQTPEGLYTFNGLDVDQFAFQVSVNPVAVPEPATWLGASLAGCFVVFSLLRRRATAC